MSELLDQPAGTKEPDEAYCCPQAGVHAHRRDRGSGDCEKSGHLRPQGMVTTEGGGRVRIVMRCKEMKQLEQHSNAHTQREALRQCTSVGVLLHRASDRTQGLHVPVECIYI